VTLLYKRGRVGYSGFCDRCGYLEEVADAKGND
jgi:hypothetical protein